MHSKPGIKNSKRKSYKDILVNIIRFIAEKITGKKVKIDSQDSSYPDVEANLRTFADSTVGDIIIPRSDICAVSIEDSLDDICKAINTKSHTRVLVYKGDLDTIVGFLHIKDVFKIISEKKQFNIQDILRTHVITTNSTRLIDILATMKKCRVHIAIVADEYGGTDGMITIEDVTEKLLGPINDEHDSQDENHKVSKDGSIIVNSRTKIEDLHRLIDLDLELSEEEDYDTVGGLIMAKIGHMPKVGEKITIANKAAFEIVEATARQVKKVKITVL